MKRLSYYIAIIFCCMLATSCEVDNYDAPDCTIQGVIYDHNGQPLQVNHGAEYIRMREISWAKGDETVFTGNRRLRVQQDGTYSHTKQFAGEYRMLPSSGNFFPYWDASDPVKDGDAAGDLVTISGVTTKDFTVTPYLTIEWVKKPTVVADNYIECIVRFKRNQKTGYKMPDVRQAEMKISRTINPNQGNIGELAPSILQLTNAMEGTDITFRTAIPVKWTGINYWIRITMNCQAVSGDADTNYDGVDQPCCSTIEQIFVP